MGRFKMRRASGRAGWAVLCLIALVAALGFIRLNPIPPVDESFLMVINCDNPLPEDYVPSDLIRAEIPFLSGTANERMRMRAEAAKAIEALFAAAKDDGITLLGVSGYRSYRSQKSIYTTRLREAGAAHVSSYIAEPGASEHQAGLAMDVTTPGIAALTEAFSDTPAYAWLTENSARHGFIIRYTVEGEEETGFAFEPWHLRYVGPEAEAIKESGMTLERYVHTHYPEVRFVEGRINTAKEKR